MIHPVKSELRRLLLGIAVAALALLACFGLMQAQLDALRAEQEGFHRQALSLTREIGQSLAEMRLPSGVGPFELAQGAGDVVFVAAVTRELTRSRALLGQLVALHERHAHEGFQPTLRRLRRAAEELGSLERQHRDQPVTLARMAGTQALYAPIVVEQARRLHEEQDAVLTHRQQVWQRQFLLAFGVLSLLIALALVLQLRRSWRGIDEILGREQQARDRLDAMLAAVPELWFELDAQGRFLAVSAAGHPHLDAPWPSLRGQPFRPVPAPAEGAATAPSWERLRQSGPWEYEVAGGAEPTAFEARLVPTRQGGWLYLSRDISQRVRAAQVLNRSKQELERQVALRTQQLTLARDAAEQANRAKSDFLSRMSHELRTPMNAVLGFAQLMSLDRQASASQRQSLDHILRAGKHLLHLINDVLDLAQVESGRLTLSPEALNLADLAAEAASLMQPLADPARVRLTADVPADLIVRGDRLRLKQVLLNLLSNAVKYNRPGGTVTLAARRSAGGRARIEVADTGQGIAAEDLEQLFQPFVRLSPDQERVEGTGIGLSISKRLVELMGGEIGATSRMGAGSTFWVELPLDAFPAPPSPHPVEGGTSAAPRGGALVLYVEDNPENSALVVKIVERHPQLKLITAASVAIGYELARAHLPDLVLLDLHLPDGSGYQLLARLQADPCTRHIPAVAVTANALPLEEVRARAAGFADFITKPLDVARMDRLLTEMLRHPPDETPGAEPPGKLPR